MASGTDLPGTFTDTAGDLLATVHVVSSTDRTHWCVLARQWDPTLPVLNALMLNPSTADCFSLDQSEVGRHGSGSAEAGM